MTEEEAKTKTCHLTIIPIHDATGGATFSPQACLGSACMAWRGGESSDFRARAEAEYRHSGRRLDATASDMTGYCGLAGKPS